LYVRLLPHHHHGAVYKGLIGDCATGIGNSIRCKGDTQVDLKSVVVKIVNTEGSTSDLKQCSKHPKPCTVKPHSYKPDPRTFVVILHCVGVHERAFQPLMLVIEAKCQHTDEVLQSRPFAVRGNRNEKELKKLAEDPAMNKNLEEAKAALEKLAQQQHTDDEDVSSSIPSPQQVTNQRHQNAHVSKSSPTPIQESAPPTGEIAPFAIPEDFFTELFPMGFSISRFEN